MKKIILPLLILLCAPTLVSAHATPLESLPEASSRVQEVPAEIRIRFSERLDEGASVITVRDESGVTVSGVSTISSEDRRVLVAPLTSTSDGPYFVTWSVVSSDDGHFTRGSFPFVVGQGALPQVAASDLEIVQISTIPEAVAMTIELLGNGILWASILIFALAVRSLLRTGGYRDAAYHLKKGYAYLLSFGSGLAISGALVQICIKANELVSLHGISLQEAVYMYAGTTAGEATLIRILSIAFVAVVATLFLKRIVSSDRFTWQEAMLLLGMVVFAIARAIVSHATANPFFPWLSVSINVVHLIEKDIWAGALLVLTILAVSKKIDSVRAPLTARIYALLTANLALISVTATYIVWLHLKSFDNLFTTKWGTVFLQLLLAALILVALRAYHMLAYSWRRKIFSEYLPFTTATELGAAVLVVFFSSVVIITSPPLPLSHGVVYSSSSEGVHIEMKASPYEDDMVLLTLQGGTAQEPVVEISDVKSGVLTVVTQKRFDGGYVFPLALLSGSDESRVRISASQRNAYDAIFEFTVESDALMGSDEANRSFDMFTIAMVMIALTGLLGTLGLNRIARHSDITIHRSRHVMPILYSGLGIATSAFIIISFASLISSPRISNPFRALCEADGNMWHLMLPMKAGVPVSETPREGCMWGMGNYQYMFPDFREYEHVRSFAPATARVTFDSKTLVAGTPQRFTVQISNKDGSPASLFTDMEKLVHVVIVSADQKSFAHIHPDDVRQLTQQEINTSTFEMSYTFPRSGEYLISIDYANGITLESAQQKVTVIGNSKQETQTALYASPTHIDGYDVALSYSQPFAGNVTTFKYEIRKNGEYAKLQPYLSAAAHIAIVKNDFSEFVHIHGEYHAPGSVIPPIIVKKGKIVHSMAAMMTPPEFSGPVDAHVIFPSAGTYTVWTQFKSDGVVHAVPLTIRVE